MRNELKESRLCDFFQNVLLIGNIESSIYKAKYLLGHAYGMLLVLPMSTLPLLFSARFSPLTFVTAEDPHIVAMCLPCPSIVLSARETVEQFTLL